MSDKQAVSFVLIHGGSFNSRYWDLVIPLLNGETLAVDLPGRRSKPADINAVCIKNWVDSVIEDIKERDLHNIVMVGHSLAGVTMPGVAAAMPERFRHIVYSSCSVPSEGNKAASFLRADLKEFMQTIEPAVLSGALSLDQDIEQSEILNTVELIGETPSQQQSDFVSDPERRAYPEALKVMFEAFSWRDYPEHIPSTYIKNNGDILVTPELQDVMIANISGNPEVIETECPHCVEVVAPELVAGILNTIAERT